MTTSTRIDTHAHFLPDFYRDALIEAGITKPDGMPAIPPWEENGHLKFMEDAGISKSYLSISSPGVYFGDQSKAKTLARRVNEYTSGLSKRHPNRFGSFASLPLPDIESSLEEIAFAMDELHADGFTLLTNYDGIYLGDETFDPVLKELNRRKAKVFLHPTTGCQCRDSKPQQFRPLNMPSPVMEFFFDAARAVVNLIMSGTVTANPDITFLIPHCGGVLPPLVDRFTFFSTQVLRSDSGALITPEEIKDILRNRFYYDLAGFSMGNQVHGLLRWTGSDRLLYGSDYPYTPAVAGQELAQNMNKEAVSLWTDKEIQRIYAGNAAVLFR